MKTILIVDDEPNVAESLKKDLEALAVVRSAFNIQCFNPDHFLRLTQAFEGRRREARGGVMVGFPSDMASTFDEADILIVDFDLLFLELDSHLSGANLAYFARCYSRCGLIITLNQHGRNSFDLRLGGHPESYADLDLGSQQLANPGLWEDGPWTGFRPWAWPLVPRALDDYESRVKKLIKDNQLEAPILDYLGFPPEIVDILPRSTLEFLGQGDKPEATTFREFVTDSGNGLQGKDKPINDEAVARIVASRIAKWLEHIVLPGQDILIDAPHLVSRYSSLLTSNLREVETWDKTVSLRGVKSLGIRYRKIAEHRFARENWLSRQAWFWNKVSEDERIDEVANPWSRTEKPDYVFCEDVSGFVHRDKTREFLADLSSPFVRRFVIDPQVEGVDYKNRRRFSL